MIVSITHQRWGIEIIARISMSNIYDKYKFTDFCMEKI